MLNATPDTAEHVVNEFKKFKVMAKVIGTLVKYGFKINVNDKEAINVDIFEMKNLWKGSTPCIMK